MKILVYGNELEFAPVGGPKGYLYGLYNGLKMVDSSDVEISFLHNKDIYKPSALVSYGKNTNNFFAKKIASLFRIYYHHRRLMRIMNSYIEPSVNLDEFDAIHFHATRDFYQCRDKLKNYKGIVILTSHSPQPLSNELIEEASKLELFLFGKEYKSLIEMDRYAFENADIILFPCEGADEAYCHQWSEYEKIKAQRKERYRYLVTGTAPAQVKTDEIDVRKKLGIPQDAFVVSYVGRHNKIKGYDRLKQIGKQFLEKHENAYFVVCGKEQPLTGLRHPRWIEIGWTNEAHSYVNASDVFILPNKETYFDLVTLEVLSTGTYLLISDTGGNRYFKKFNDVGISFFNDEKEALEVLECNYGMSECERQKMKNNNIQLYSRNFTTEIFAKSYVEFYKSLENFRRGLK
ncbi:MAG: glycosyltransferase family 4 protein [Lachnospiraceae bacterium]